MARTSCSTERGGTSEQQIRVPNKGGCGPIPTAEPGKVLLRTAMNHLSSTDKVKSLFEMC